MVNARIQVRLPVVVWNGTGRHDTTVQFSYSSSDPYAVELATSQDSVPWRFHREILVGGFTGVSGQGDVRIEPDDAGLVFRLDNGSRAALVLVPREPLIEFLRQVFAIVPAGCEHVDVPDFVDELLDDGSES